MTITQKPFEADLLDQLLKRNHSQKNIIFSPTSLRLAFELARRGAQGKTAEEIQEVFTLNDERLKAYQRYFVEQEKLGVNFDIANSVWVDRSFKFQKKFLKSVTENLHADSKEFDRMKAEESAKNVNQWVSGKTNHMIQNLITSDFIKPETRAILVNAIYFLGKWMFPFEKQFTRPGVFNGESEQNVSMMSQTRDYFYSEDKDFQLLWLPYKEGQFEFIVALPRKGLDLRKSSGDVFQKVLKKIAKNEGEYLEVDLKLPKFDIRSRAGQLIESLRHLGVKTAFSSQANFRYMIEGKSNLTIGKIAHEAVVKIDEAGTEAAAATAIGFEVTGMPMKKAPPKKFHVDRPFLFAISDSKSKESLFVGYISKIED